MLTESGKLYAWGNNIAGGVGNDTGYSATSNKKPPVYYSSPQDITRLFNGDKIVKLINHLHTFAAITSSGKVYYWGHELSDKDKKAIIHPVALSELSPYHIIGFGRDIGFGNGFSYVASHPDNMSDYLAFSKDTIFALNYGLNTRQLQYHDEAKIESSHSSVVALPLSTSIISSTVHPRRQNPNRIREATTPKAPGVPNTGSEPLFADGYQAPIFARH